MIKFQTLSIIFVLIIVPITMLLSYYINSQIDTIALQNSYDTKLLNATYDAIIAFQLNTINNSGYSTNAEALRRDINASVNTFTTSLANNFGLSGYGSSQMLSYIPAVLYTLYDGYYIYAPMAINNIDEDGNITTTYEHILKSYVYYTARYYAQSGQYDFVVNYSLDNYIVVYGTVNGKYVSKAGYLTYTDKYVNNGITLSGDAKTYFEESEVFTSWVKSNLSNISIEDIVVEVNGSQIKTASSLTDTTDPYYVFKGNTNKIFNINNDNDPEVKTSTFWDHKNTVIKNSIQSNLNTAIGNYTKQAGLGKDYNFKLPILSATEWDKILSNVSITTFMQGLSVGLSTYNNYMIVSSTGNNLYVDPEELYFVTYDDSKEIYGSYYHRINCPELAEELKNDSSLTVEGYMNTTFDGILTTIKDTSGNETQEYAYFGASRKKSKEEEINFIDDGFFELETDISYEHGSTLACYKCIVNSSVGGIIYDTEDKDIDSNGAERGRTYAINKDNNLITFVTKTNTGTDYSSYYTDEVVAKLRNAYYNALFKERYNQSKVSSYVNKAS